ncbi:hypothetical protein [Streptomyces sp. NPDC005374]
MERAGRADADADPWTWPVIVPTPQLHLARSLHVDAGQEPAHPS